MGNGWIRLDFTERENVENIETCALGNTKRYPNGVRMRPGEV